MRDDKLPVDGSENCLLIAATLSVKNEAYGSALRFVARGGRFSRYLKVENSFRVSVVL